MPGYTAGETIKIGWLLARAVKQSVAGDREVDTVSPKVKKKLDRVFSARDERDARERAIAERDWEMAKNAVAAAHVAVRNARGKEKDAARKALKAAEGRERIARRTANSYR